MVLEQINNPNDIKKISPNLYPQLAEEIREFLITKISKTGGHLASNLGVVELTMALHLTLNLPEDKLIFDVGHQSYTHKILTVRKLGFDQLRKFGGMSGFPKRKESDYDAFDTGHSSTSISAGLGYVTARDVQHEKYSVVSVIGDGALTGGMAYEALNNAGRCKSNFIIVLNDNKMSIAPNVGGVTKMLNTFRTSSSYYDFKENVQDTLEKIPKGEKIVETLRRTKRSIRQQTKISNPFFESMGITYLGPIDGHDMGQLIRTFQTAKRIDHAVLVHVITKKGKGYIPAEQNPSRFHGIGPFDVKTGYESAKSDVPTYSKVFSEKICELAKKDEKIVAVTAAMPDGTGLKKFSKYFPNRFMDVGIAEAHAVTYCAGMAAGGLKPVFAVYSSFLQRGFDQILHDVCIQNLHVTFCLDRAGLVGSDGETHQGIFDLSFLSTIPNMTIMAPKNGRELEAMLEFATQEFSAPIAIRYPRGAASDVWDDVQEKIVAPRAEVIRREKDIALLAVGIMNDTAKEVSARLKEAGFHVTVVNMRFVKPFDEILLHELSKDHSLFVTMEENVKNGGFGQAVSQFVERAELNTRVLTIALPDDYVEHGNVDILRHECGIDADTVTERIVTIAGNLGIETKGMGNP